MQNHSTEMCFIHKEGTIIGFSPLDILLRVSSPQLFYIVDHYHSKLIIINFILEKVGVHSETAPVLFFLIFLEQNSSIKDLKTFKKYSHWWLLTYRMQDTVKNWIRFQLKKWICYSNGRLTCIMRRGLIMQGVPTIICLSLGNQLTPYSFSFINLFCGYLTHIDWSKQD